jgi:hypothetical protein
MGIFGLGQDLFAHGTVFRQVELMGKSKKGKDE